MNTLKDLILMTSFENVWEKIMLHYSERMERESSQNYIDFHTLYVKFNSVELKANSSNMVIYINAFKTDRDGESVYQPSFDEDNHLLYFDVSGRDDEYIGYSLVSSKFNEWLNYNIDSKLLSTMCYENIIAHCMWEMTFFGYDNFNENTMNG